MKVAVIPIIIRVFRIISKNVEKKIGELDIQGRSETVQTTSLLKSARLLCKVLGTCCHSASNENHQLELG